MTDFTELETLGFARLGDGHGRFPTLRKGRVTVDTGTCTLFLKGVGALVSTKVRAFMTEGEAAEAAMQLSEMLEGAAE